MAMKSSNLGMVLLFMAMMMYYCSLQAQGIEYRGYIDTGYSFGAGDRSKPQWLLQTVHGMDFIPGHLFVGGGVGVGIAVESGEKAYSLPVFADVRYTLGDSKVRPYADIRTGYSFIWDSKHPGGNEGGFYFAPSVGVMVPVSSGVAINAGLCYMLSRAHYSYGHGINRENTDYNAGGMGLMVGVTF